MTVITTCLCQMISVRCNHTVWSGVGWTATWPKHPKNLLVYEFDVQFLRVHRVFFTVSSISALRL